MNLLNYLNELEHRLIELERYATIIAAQVANARVDLCSARDALNHFLHQNPTRELKP